MRARLSIVAALFLLSPLLAAQVVRTTVRAVHFRGTSHLPNGTLERVAARYRGRPIYDAGWLQELRERVRDAEQQHGYFRCEVKTKLETVSEDASRPAVSATVFIEEGPQYRLKGISVTSAKAFAPEVLAGQFPLRPGDIFNTAGIRQGLENLRKLYGTQGYINFIAVPDTQTNEAARTIALVIDVDEGAAYHVGKVQVLGLTAERAQQLLSSFPLKTGDTYRGDYIEAFYRQNRVRLPHGAKPDINTWMQQDNQSHTVDIFFDFRPPLGLPRRQVESWQGVGRDNC